MTRLYFPYKIGNLDTGTQRGKTMCRHTERTPCDNECRHGVMALKAKQCQRLIVTSKTRRGKEEYATGFRGIYGYFDF